MTPGERSRLPTPAQVKGWETLNPEISDRIMAEIEREEEHRRRMEVAELRVGVFGQVCALITVIVLAILAWHFVNHGAAWQGAGIITAGAGAIVTVFVTGRITRHRQPPAAPEDRPARQPPAAPEDRPARQPPAAPEDQPAPTTDDA